MTGRLTASSLASFGERLGRHEVFISDEESRSVLVLEFVFRSDSITVWQGSRTLAVMDRRSFFGWLWSGGDYVIDDLAWSVDGRTTLLTIDARRTYAVDVVTVMHLAEHTGYAAIGPAEGPPVPRTP